jgi:hypothetical protein
LFLQYPVFTLAALLVSVHVVSECAWRVGRRWGAARQDVVPTEPVSALLAVLGLLLARAVSTRLRQPDSEFTVATPST